MTFEWPPVASFRGYAQLAKADPRLRPGMNATMDVVIQRLADAISVPSKALFTRNGKPIVYVAGKGQYRVSWVKVVARNPDEVAVEGIDQGAMVALTEPDAAHQL
jgi:hypothetical protein